MHYQIALSQLDKQNDTPFPAFKDLEFGILRKLPHNASHS
jgi:hypothetical protein